MKYQMKKFKLNKSSTRSGFTMVELSLTMAFVAVLLITIAIITTNIVTIYQKGLTLKAVNSVGRGLTDEFITGINTAPAVDTTSLCNNYVSVPAGDESAKNQCIASHAFQYVFQERRDDDGHQLNGILCTGNYSYLWNTHKGFETGKTVTIKYRYGSGATDTDTVKDVSNGKAPRLVRIKDPTYRLCTAVVNSNYASSYSDDVNLDPDSGIKLIDITEMFGSPSGDPKYNILSETPEQGMLRAFDLDLTLYELTIFPISQDSMTLRTYMSGTFVLATERGDIEITNTGDYCQADGASSLGNLGSEFNYCAINKFNFAARTAGVN